MSDATAGLTLGLLIGSMKIWKDTVSATSKWTFLGFVRCSYSSTQAMLNIAFIARAMEMYRSFCRKPGDLRDNADVQSMGRKMLEYDEAMSKAAEDDPELAEKKLELHEYFLESVMKIGVTRVHAEMQADESASFIRNLLMALFGGFALVVPMLIMTLHSTRLTSLLTTSVFVFTVALLLAWYMRETDPMQIVSVTAAYAAVLVVFVGTSTIPSTGS